MYLERPLQRQFLTKNKGDLNYWSDLESDGEDPAFSFAVAGNHLHNHPINVNEG